jgi:predicted XRE-type DNA-binding protein
MKNSIQASDKRYEQIRGELKKAVCEKVEEWQVSQTLAADRFGIGRTRLNNILNGDRRNVSVSGLLAMLLRAGVNVTISIDDSAGEADKRVAADHVRG